MTEAVAVNVETKTCSCLLSQLIRRYVGTFVNKSRIEECNLNSIIEVKVIEQMQLDCPSLNEQSEAISYTRQQMRGEPERVSISCKSQSQRAAHTSDRVSQASSNAQL